MLELRVGNIYVDIIGDLKASEWKEIEKRLSFHPAGYVFSPAYNRWIRDKDGHPIKRVWDGWKRQAWRNKKRTYFPTGLYSIVTDYLKEAKIKYRGVDIRSKPDPNLNIEFSENLESRDYQERVCDDACRQQRGIVHAATGSGKTIISAGIIKRLRVSPFLFFVTSIDLLEQAKDSLEKFLRINGCQPRIGQIGGGKIEIRDINVLTVQTAVRALGKKWDVSTKFDGDDTQDDTPIAQYAEEIKELMSCARGCICDEVQHWRADTCQLVARALHNCYYTYGMSATPYRDEGDDLMIQACFGKKVAEITASELIKQNWLIRPDIKMIHLRGKRSVYKQWQTLYKDQVVENEYYNGIVANIANAYINQKRLVLVLVQQINHGQYLESLIPGSVFLSGSSPKNKRSREIQRLRNRDISCIISTSIFDEGIDVRPLDTLLLAGQGKSKVRAMQRIGRILRPFEGKTKATAIDFCLHQKYLEDHAVEREKMYRTEPEFIVEDIEPGLRR